MSTFEALPRSDYYQMNTWVTEETFSVLKSFRDFSGQSVTEAVSQAVSAHKWLHDCYSAGGLVIASSTESVEALMIPSEREPTNPERAHLQLRIDRELLDYLMPHADQHNMDDLTGFWGSAVSLYSNLVERQLQGATFHGIMPSAYPLRNINTYTPISPFDH